MRKPKCSYAIVFAIILGTLIGSTQQGKCPFGYGSSDQEQDNAQSSAARSHPRVGRLNTAFYPYQILKCQSNKVITTSRQFTANTYEQIVREIFTLYDSKSSDDAKALAACMLRLAGHDFMDFRNRSGSSTFQYYGGSDGCLLLQADENKGLFECVANSNIEPIYQSYCDQVSLADFIVIAAEGLMSRTATDYNTRDPFASGTLARKFKDRFRAGRTTLEECPDNAPIPNAENGCDDIKSIFVDEIYGQCISESVTVYQDRTGTDQRRSVLNETSAWTLAAAMMGAHTLGQAQITNTGYNGHWSDSVNQGIFNNNYFYSLITNGWGPETAINGDNTKNQWERVDLEVESRGHHMMMLNSDICLAYKDLKASSRNTCCAWTNSRGLFPDYFIEGERNSYCGTTVSSGSDRNFDSRAACCNDISRSGDCDNAATPNGPAYDAVRSFAFSEREFLDKFTKAWWLATENGVHTPTFSCLPSNWAEEERSQNLRITGLTLLLQSTLTLLFLYRI